MHKLCAYRSNFSRNVIVLSHNNDETTVIAGAIKRIIEKKDNLTLGFFSRLPPRDSTMTASYVYYVSNLIWLIPPGRPFGDFEKLMMPFQNDIWIACSTVFSIAFLVIFIIKCFGTQQMRNFTFGRHIASPELNIVNLLLSGSIPRLPTRNFARTILLLFMFFCFIIQNSYTGRLFYFMRNSLSHPDFSSTKELLDNNFTFYTFSSSRDFLLGFPDILERLQITTADVFTKLTEDTVDPNAKIALLTTKDHLIWRNIQALPRRYFNHAEEVIYRTNVVIYMHKQSCLEQQVNSVILSLTSGGLIKYFAKTFIDPAFAKKPIESKTKALKFETLYGAFTLLAIGLGLSSLVFTVESTFTRTSKLFHYYFRRRWKTCVLFADCWLSICCCCCREIIIYIRREKKQNKERKTILHFCCVCDVFRMPSMIRLSPHTNISLMKMMMMKAELFGDRNKEEVPNENRRMCAEHAEIESNKMKLSKESRSHAVPCYGGFFFFQNDIQLFRLFYLDQYIKHFRHYLKIFHCWRRLGSFFLYSYMFHIHSSSSAGVSNSIFHSQVHNNFSLVFTNTFQWNDRNDVHFMIITWLNEREKHARLFILLFFCSSLPLY